MWWQMTQRRWWLTVPVFVGALYLILIVMPFYANGMYRYSISDFDREGMQAGDSLPFSVARPIWIVLWIAILPAALFGKYILPTVAALWIALSKYSAWPTDARLERRASTMLGGVLLALACLLYFANMTKIVAWFIGD
jgi:hypothetical protein